MLAGQGALIVAAGVAGQELAQLLGVGWMGQPQQRLDVELLHALAGQTEPGADGGEALRRVCAQPVVGHDDVVQAGWEVGDEGAESALHVEAVEFLHPIGGRQGGRGPLWGCPTCPLIVGDSSPHRAGNGRDRVGAELGAPAGIVVLEGLPEPDPSGVESIGEGQPAAPLLAHDPAHQAFVGGHLGARDDRSLFWDGCARLRHSNTSFWREVRCSLAEEVLLCLCTRHAEAAVDTCPQQLLCRGWSLPLYGVGLLCFTRCASPRRGFEANHSVNNQPH